MQKRAKVTVALLVSFCLLIAAAGILWHVTRPQGVEGEKSIVVSVVRGEDTAVHTLRTDALFLRGALEENGLIEGDETAFGLFVKTVGGYTVNEAAMEWWNFAVNGEDLMVGVDEAVIHDGDAVTITLMVGW